MVAKLLPLDKAVHAAHTAAMDSEVSLLQATSVADPQSLYARWRARGPVCRDPATALWIASTAEAVEAALRHPGLRVRPPAEPVPRALQETAAGAVFAQLVRMTDGAFHAEHRPAVDRAAQAWTEQDVEASARRAAQELAERGDANAWLQEVPVRTMARLLGLPDAELDAVTQDVLDFVAGIAPGASAAQVGAATAAAERWTARCEAQGVSGPRAANRLALLQQSVDATAGLIGNAILAWQRAPEVVDSAFIAEVARVDPPIHHTRRFAAEAVTLLGQPLQPGDGVLVLLASANHDPAAGGRDFGFGAGAHACPGQRIAHAIARTAVAFLADAPERIASFRFTGGWRPLANARIPVFAGKE